MKKLILLLLIFISIQTKSQVTITGENTTDERFNISIIVNNDTVVTKRNLKKGYVINIKYAREFTVVFYSKNNTQVVNVYASDRNPWFDIDIDLTKSESTTMLWDPNQDKYISLVKKASSSK